MGRKPTNSGHFCGGLPAGRASLQNLEGRNLSTSNFPCVGRPQEGVRIGSPLYCLLRFLNWYKNIPGTNCSRSSGGSRGRGGVGWWPRRIAFRLNSATNLPHARMEGLLGRRNPAGEIAAWEPLAPLARQPARREGCVSRTPRRETGRQADSRAPTECNLKEEKKKIFKNEKGG